MSRAGRPREQQVKHSVRRPLSRQVRSLKRSPTGSDTSATLGAEAEQQGQARPAVMQLSPRGLTLSLIAVTFIPVALAATVWLAIPANPEPPLAAEVHLEPVAWPREGGNDVRLMPGVLIHNASDERWTNLSMGINNQFYFYAPDPLGGGQDFSVPLSFFRTSGNQQYRPKFVRIKKLTVYAQLPSGRRAIHEIRPPPSAHQQNSASAEASAEAREAVSH